MSVGVAKKNLFHSAPFSSRDGDFRGSGHRSDDRVKVKERELWQRKYDSRRLDSRDSRRGESSRDSRRRDYSRDSLRGYSRDSSRRDSRDSRRGESSRDNHRRDSRDNRRRDSRDSRRGESSRDNNRRDSRADSHRRDSSRDSRRRGSRDSHRRNSRADSCRGNSRIRRRGDSRESRRGDSRDSHRQGSTDSRLRDSRDSRRRGSTDRRRTSPPTPGAHCGGLTLESPSQQLQQLEGQLARARAEYIHLTLGIARRRALSPAAATTTVRSHGDHVRVAVRTSRADNLASIRCSMVRDRVGVGPERSDAAYDLPLPVRSVASERLRRALNIEPRADGGGLMDRLEKSRCKRASPVRFRVTFGGVAARKASLKGSASSPSRRVARRAPPPPPPPGRLAGTASSRRTSRGKMKSVPWRARRSPSPSPDPAVVSSTARVLRQMDAGAAAARAELRRNLETAARAIRLNAEAGRRGGNL